LIDDIRNLYGEFQFFDYEKYITDLVTLNDYSKPFIAKNSTTFPTKTIRADTVQLDVIRSSIAAKDSVPQTKTQFIVTLNKLKYYIHKDPYLGVFFDGESVYYRYSWIYANTEKYLTPATDTISESDWNMNEHYNAIQIVTRNIEDIYTVDYKVDGTLDEIFIHNYVINRCKDFFLKLNSDSSDYKKKLKALYESAPLFALKNTRSTINKLYDLKNLLAYDNGNWLVDGWFKDASNAILRLLSSINVVELHNYFSTTDNNKEILRDL
jgi:hypothetical protein